MLVRPTAPQVTTGLDSPAAGIAGGGGEPAVHARPVLAIEVAEQPGMTVLTMAGHLVAETVVTAEARILTTTVLTARPLHLVLDLARIDAIDRSGTHLLTKARFAVGAARGALHIVAPPGAVAYHGLNRYLRQVTVQRLQDVPTGSGPHTDPDLR